MVFVVSPSLSPSLYHRFFSFHPLLLLVFWHVASFDFHLWWFLLKISEEFSLWIYFKANFSVMFNSTHTRCVLHRDRKVKNHKREKGRARRKKNQPKIETSFAFFKTTISICRIAKFPVLNELSFPLWVSKCNRHLQDKFDAESSVVTQLISCIRFTKSASENALHFVFQSSNIHNGKSEWHKMKEKHKKMRIST